MTMKEKEVLVERNTQLLEKISRKEAEIYRLKKQLSIAIECIEYYYEVDLALQVHSNLKSYVNKAKVSLKQIKALEKLNAEEGE